MVQPTAAVIAAKAVYDQSVLDFNAAVVADDMSTRADMVVMFSTTATANPLPAVSALPPVVTPAAQAQAATVIFNAVDAAARSDADVQQRMTDLQARRITMDTAERALIAQVANAEANDPRNVAQRAFASVKNAFTRNNTDAVQDCPLRAAQGTQADTILNALQLQADRSANELTAAQLARDAAAITRLNQLRAEGHGPQRHLDPVIPPFLMGFVCRTTQLVSVS